MNPLLEIQFRVPFDQIDAAQVEPAIDELLADAAKRLDSATADPNPLVATDTMTERLDFALSVVRHIESVATTPAFRAAYNAVQPKVSAFYSSIPLNEGLWRAIQKYAATDEGRALQGTHKRFLTKTIDSFKRHGADLDPAGKARLKVIDVALSDATTKFAEHVLDATNAWDMVVTAEEQLKGLPPSAIAMARASAESKGVEGWRFTLQGPSYVSVMTYLDDSRLREQVWRAYNTRASSGPLDNRALMTQILELRKEKAKLLGFKDFSDLVLDDRMAHTGERAQNFLKDLREKTDQRFREENQELEKFAGRKLEPWDIGYWAEKQRAALYDFDEEELRPYFPLERVVSGMFEIFSQILGIRVAQVNDMPVWEPDVKTYEVRDAASGAHLGSFYADWYPRENKRGGAWMDSLITGDPAKSKPHLGLICGNLTPPVDGKPALLTHREAETIFHEFGHLGDSNAKNLAEDLEHSGNDALQREVGPQFFFIEVVQGRALFFGPVTDIPGLQLAPRERFQFLILFAEALAGFLAEVFEEILRPFPGMRHAIIQNKVREILEAQQLGFFRTQLQNLSHQGAIVQRTRRSARVVSPPDLLAQARIVQIGHHRNVTGTL